MSSPKLSMICVAYQRPIQIKVLVASILAQTFQDWELLIFHDGPDGYEPVRDAVLLFSDPRIQIRATEVRFNDFGHSLREGGFEYSKGEFIGQTNDDNYYCPEYFQRMLSALESIPADFAFCDMLTNYDGWAVRETHPAVAHIDAGGWIARRSILPAKWNDKGRCGDGVFVEQIVAGGVRVIKIPGIHFVHN